MDSSQRFMFSGPHYHYSPEFTGAPAVLRLMQDLARVGDRRNWDCIVDARDCDA